jgi:hypothetical protein
MKKASKRPRKPKDTSIEFNAMEFGSDLIDGELLIRARVTGEKVHLRVVTKHFPRIDIPTVAKDIELQLAKIFAEQPAG